MNSEGKKTPYLEFLFDRSYLFLFFAIFSGVTAFFSGALLIIGLSFVPVVDKYELLTNTVVYTAIFLVIGRLLYGTYASGILLVASEPKSKQLTFATRIAFLLLFLPIRIATYAMPVVLLAYILYFILKYNELLFPLMLVTTSLLFTLFLLRECVLNTTKSKKEWDVEFSSSKAKQHSAGIVLLGSGALLFCLSLGIAWISFLQVIPPTMTIDYVDKTNKSQKITIVMGARNGFIAFLNSDRVARYVPWHVVKELSVTKGN